MSPSRSANVIFRNDIGKAPMHFRKIVFCGKEQAAARLRRAAYPWPAQDGGHGELQRDQAFARAAVTVQQRDVTGWN
jgi:hypothetical protein